MANPLSQPQNINGLVAEGVLAEESGLDFFGLGEHHIEEIPLSAPTMVLAAIAARTSRIHLGSAVTVLSSDDPVRVFQRYAILDALSSRRAEVILGRGSSTESFPLFGFDLTDYDRLFEEKLELFAQLRTELFREATAQSGFAPLPIEVHSPGHVAATDEQACSTDVGDGRPLIGYLFHCLRTGARPGSVQALNEPGTPH